MFCMYVRMTVVIEDTRCEVNSLLVDKEVSAICRHSNGNQKKEPSANKQEKGVYLTIKGDIDAMRRLYELMKKKCKLYIQQTTTTDTQ